MPMKLMAGTPLTSRPAAFVRRSGFTLVEFVASAAVLSVIGLAVGAVTVLACRRVTNDSSDSKTAACASAAVGDLLADLRVATVVTERTDKGVTFTVPDRNGDGQPETLRYYWSGLAGEPLFRTFNGSSPAVVADRVYRFDLGYLTQVAGPPPPQESAEFLVIGHDDDPGGDFKDYTLNKDRWCANFVLPVMPTNALSWRIRRVAVMAKRDGAASDSLAIEVANASASLTPTTPTLASVTISESVLGSGYAWAEVVFPNCPDLNPAKGYCLVVRQVTTASNGGRVNYEEKITTSRKRWTTTSNKGGSWTVPSTTMSMRFCVYGTVTTQGPPRWP